MQLNCNNHEVDPLDEDCCVLTREGALHKQRQCLSLCSKGVVRSTEPNLALKKQTQCTYNKKAGLCVLLKTHCPPFEILTVLMTATEKQHNLLLPRVISNSHVITRFTSTDTGAAASFLQNMAKRND